MAKTKAQLEKKIAQLEKKKACKPCKTKRAKVEGKVKRKKRAPMDTVCQFNFNTYIYKVLKQVHPDTGISGAAKSMVNDLAKIIISKITKVTNQMLSRSGRMTVTARDVQNAVRIAFPGELAKHAVSEGVKALNLYSNAGTDKNAPKKMAEKAGLVFSVSRVLNLATLESTASRKGKSGGVYLTAVVEYICAEILELAGNIARDRKRVRITTRHVKLAILGDEELDKLFKHTAISGGVLPNIHPSLEKKKKSEGGEKPKRKTTKAKKPKSEKTKKPKKGKKKGKKVVRSPTY
jgi:histone H3/H4